MVINYLKLKLNIYLNRFNAKKKEEAYGELFGYAVIISFISLIFYLVYSKIFDMDLEKILPMVYINFIFISIINIASTFNYLYKSVFKASDREILFMLPCKKIDIILIKYIEVLLEFWKIYLLFLIPSLIALLFVEIKTIFSSIAICLVVNLAGIVIISLLMMLLFFSVKISKGKNIKSTCLIISFLFFAMSFIIIFFCSDTMSVNLINKYMIVKILFLPFFSIYTFLINYTHISGNILFLLLDLIYTAIVFFINSIYFSKCIDNGILLLDSSEVKKVKFINFLLKSKLFEEFETFFIKKGLKYNSISILKKDVVFLLSNSEIFKLYAEVVFLFSIFNIKFECDPNGIFYFLLLIIKTVIIVITLSYFITRSEKESFYIILNSGIRIRDLIKSKAVTIISIVMPFITVMDIIAAIIIKQNFMVLFYEVLVDLSIIIFVSIVSIICIFKHLNVSVKKVEVEFIAGIEIFFNLIVLFIPLILINVFVMSVTFESLNFKFTKLLFLLFNVMIITLLSLLRGKFMFEKLGEIIYQIY